MPRFLICFLFALMPYFIQAQDTVPEKSGASGIAVIELFTSQGDINSPPADQLLSEIINDAAKNNQPVYCLSMHVDFWNRYGWNDPYSALKYTRRLMNYTSVLEMKETYTPFMILNGRTILPVKDRTKTFETIAAAIQKKTLYHPTFTYQVFDDTLDVSYQLNTAPASKQNNLSIHVAVVEAGLTTEVTKGDNAAKTLKNDNVTRLFFTSPATAQKGLVRVPLKKLKPSSTRTIILFLQDKTTRAVLGATSAPFR